MANPQGPETPPPDPSIQPVDPQENLGAELMPDAPSAGEVVEPTVSPEGGAEIDAAAQQVIEAKSRVDSGQGTTEDQALVAGAEIGAKMAIEGSSDTDGETTDTEVTTGSETADDSAETDATTDTVTGEPAETTPDSTVTPNETTESEPEAVSEGPKVISGDLLEASKKQADEVKSKIDTEMGWGEDTKELETKLQGHEDMIDAMSKRDYKDEEGQVRDAVTGEVKPEAEANQGPELTESEEDERFKDKGLMEDGGLLDMWADAEAHNDKTLANDVIEQIEKRFNDNVNVHVETPEDQARVDKMREEYIDLVHDALDHRVAELKGADQAIDPEGVTPDITGETPGNEEQVIDDGPIPPVETGPGEDGPGETGGGNHENDGTTGENGDILKRLDDIDRELARLRRLINGPDGPGEDGPGEDGPGETGGGERVEDRPLTPEEVHAQNTKAFEDASERYAKARIAAERPFAGKEKKAEMDSAAAELSEKFQAFIASGAEFADHNDKAYGRLIEENTQITSEIQDQLDGLLAQKEAMGEDYDGSLEDIITKRQNQLEISKANQEVLEQRDKELREKEIAQWKLTEVTNLSKTVDEKMLKERIAKHPKLSKVTNWLQTHPKTRIAVGLGLTGLGIVGAATFNAPLVALAATGKAGLRGFGSYNATRGVGEIIASRRFNKAQMDTVDDYLEAAKIQSTTRRRSKYAAIVIATGLAAVPAINSMVDSLHSTPTGGGHVAEHLAPKTTPAATGTETVPTTAAIPTIEPVDGGTLPWTYAMDNLHTNISDPNVLNGLVNNKFGITFTGNGLGGGSGAFESVTIPGQGTFSDLGHINSAISYVLGNNS